MLLPQDPPCWYQKLWMADRKKLKSQYIRTLGFEFHTLTDSGSGKTDFDRGMNGHTWWLPPLRLQRYCWFSLHGVRIFGNLGSVLMSLCSISVVHRYRVKFTFAKLNLYSPKSS